MKMHVMCLTEKVWMNKIEATQREENKTKVISFTSQMFLLDINKVTSTPNGDLHLSRFSHFSSETKTILNCLKAEFDSIINQKTQFIIQQLKRKEYQHCNKMGKYLANKLKHKQENAIIPPYSINQNNPEPTINNLYFKLFFLPKITLIESQLR